MAAPLIACHECDLLQRETAVPPGGTARCARCDAVLYRNRPDSLNRSLAFAVGAAVFFVIANALPLVGLEVQGERVQTTLFGAARALYEGGMHTLGAIVLITTVVAPLIELVAILGLLLPLQFERMPRGSAIVFRILRAVQAWRMPDVMFIGVLVALVKLTHLAEVIPGIALFSLAAFMILLAACVSTFNPRALWAKLDARQ
jgi:paraquat-inducible protein A